MLTEVDAVPPVGTTPPSPPRGRLRGLGATWRAARPGDRARLVAVAVAAVAAVAVPLDSLLGAGGPVRVLLAMVFLVAVPGVAIVGAIRLPDALVRVGLAVALSIAAHILVAVALLVSGLWSTIAAQALLAVVALGATPFAWRTTVAAAREQHAPARPDPDGAARGSTLPARAGAACVLQAAIALFWIQLGSLDLAATGAVGLAGVVRWPFVMAVALVMGLIAYHLLRPWLDHAVLTAATVTLIVLLYGLVNLADDAAAVPTGWLHAGFVRYITDNGVIAVSYDARFSWPGFFAAGAQLVASTGLPDATAFLRLSPIFYNVAALPMLYVIGRCITRSERLAWLGVVVYLCANWFQQDYFSPQGTVLLMWLAILATMLWSVTSAPPEAEEPDPGTRIRRMVAAARRVPEAPPGVSARTSIAVHLVLAVLVVAVVVSHQLTPVAMIMALFVFAVTGSTPFRSLWLFAALVTVTWFSYGATDFWYGHLEAIFGDVGRVGNVGTAVGARIRGDPTYQLGQFVRVGWSGVLFLVATVGLTWVALRHLYLVVGLVVTPFLLVGLQSYGGEVLIRSFVYSTALLAPLAALAVGGFLLHGARLWRVAVLAALLVAAAGFHTYTRGLNVAFDRLPASTFAASRFATDQLPQGGSIGVLAQIGVPPQDQRITELSVVGIGVGAQCVDTAFACAAQLRPDLILITDTQERIGELQGGRPEGWADAIADELVTRGLYERIYATPEAQVLRLRVLGGG